MVKLKERGWGGHFICANRCLFRRNTLIDGGKKKIVVSTVGGMKNLNDIGIDTIGGGGRYYETMAFEAHKDGEYWEASVSNELSFESEWSICADSVDELPDDVDNKANDMHDAIVSELAQAMRMRDEDI